MATWGLKLRFIFLPFLIIGLSFISFYSLINWLLFIKFDLFSIREVIRNIGLPLLLSIIPLWMWLKPGINLLAFKDEKQERPLIYLILAAAAIALPTIIAQEYLTTATGKLTELEGINSITTLDKTKYYTVKNYYVSKKKIGAHVTSEVTGSKDENLRVTLYIALPVYESLRETRKKNPSAWLGIKYTEKIKNDLSDVEWERKFDAFLDKSENDLESKDIQKFVYLDRIGNSDDLEGYKNALNDSPKFKGNNDIVLVPIQTPFEARNGHKFAMDIPFLCPWLLYLASDDFLS